MLPFHGGVKVNQSTIDPLVQEGMEARHALAESLYRRILGGEDIFYAGVIEKWPDLVISLRENKGDALFLVKNSQKKYDVAVRLLEGAMSGFKVKYGLDELVGEREAGAILRAYGRN